MSDCEICGNEIGTDYVVCDAGDCGTPVAHTRCATEFDDLTRAMLDELSQIVGITITPPVAQQLAYKINEHSERVESLRLLLRAGL
jgi:hypothetical protein